MVIQNSERQEPVNGVLIFGLARFMRQWINEMIGGWVNR